MLYDDYSSQNSGSGNERDTTNTSPPKSFSKYRPSDAPKMILNPPPLRRISSSSDEEDYYRTSSVIAPPVVAK
jgi:hypothetical protein